MEVILKYFTDLTDRQREQFMLLESFYREWNAKINVISRKDIDHLYTHHVLHAMGIAKMIQFKPRTHILDIGTGGGFPGIPLAILFPDAQFHLIDGTAKKIRVVNMVAEHLGLENVVAEQVRAEELKHRGKEYDFVVARGVTKLATLYEWTRQLVVAEKTPYNSLPNGLIALKGGKLALEMRAVKRKVWKYALKDWFEEAFFEEKFVLYVGV